MSTSSITREQAVEIAAVWAPLLNECLVNMILDPTQHRDIGKLLANATEGYVNRWISERTGRPIQTVVGESYDGITSDDKPRVRNQVKFRMGNWHLETTRRNSQKNVETNSTGHVAYRANEFDVIAIFTPGPGFSLTTSKIRLIPVAALINPEKPDQLVTNINSKLRKCYDSDSKTEEVLQQVYGAAPASTPS